MVLGADPFGQPGRPHSISLLLHWGKTGAGTEAVGQDLKSDLLEVKGEGANVFIGDWENGWDKVG